MNANEKVDRYLVEGNLPLGICKFALPFMVAYLLQALYGAIDLYVVGKFCDPAAVSAVGIGAQMLHLLLAAVFGLSMGGTVLIGFNVGAKDDEGAANAIGSTSTLFALLAFIATPIVALSTDYCVGLMQTPQEAVDFTRQYVFICACGLPFIVGYNVVGAIYRGLGDSVTPTIFVVVACLANIVGDFILIGYFKLGPAGAAYATVASQALSFFYALVHMRKTRFNFEFHRTNFLLRRKSVRAIFKVGVPLALQDVLTCVSFLVIFAIVNMMGLYESAGLAVAERVIGFLLLPPIAFSSAVTTATSQNCGAKKYRRAFKAFLYGASFSLVFGVSFWLLCQICPSAIASVFTHDPDVAEQGAKYLRSFTIDCILVAFIFNINGYFCGCGKAIVVSAHSVFAAVCARIPMSYFFSKLPNATLYHVGFAAPLASLTSIVVCVCYFVWLRATGELSLKDVE